MNRISARGLLALAVLAALVLVFAAQPSAAASAQDEPPAGENPTQPLPAGEGVSPIVGILVLLAPLAFIAWKSRGKKQAPISSGACLPVIGEKDRPFEIKDD